MQVQIGVFDPYSDDPRLAVKKLCLCPVTGLLTVAGTAGQIVVAEFSDLQAEKEVPVLIFCNILVLILIFTNWLSILIFDKIVTAKMEIFRDKTLFFTCPFSTFFRMLTMKRFPILSSQVKFFLPLPLFQIFLYVQISHSP